MKTIATLGVAIGAFAAMVYADTWTGKLVDANCQEKSQQGAPDTKQKGVTSCAASPSTAAFALETSDGTYRLDASGNSKAATAVRGNPDNKSPIAEVSGAMEGQTLKVDSISVR